MYPVELRSCHAAVKLPANERGRATRTGDSLDLRVSSQPEARGDHYERDACADVAEARTVEVEADRAARYSRRTGSQTKRT